MSYAVDVTIHNIILGDHSFSTTHNSLDEAVQEQSERIAAVKAAIEKNGKKVFNDDKAITPGTYFISCIENTTVINEVYGKINPGWIVNSVINELKPVVTVTVRVGVFTVNIQSLINELENLRNKTTADDIKQNARYTELDFQYGSLLVTSRREKNDTLNLLNANTKLIDDNNHIMHINEEMNQTVMDLADQNTGFINQNTNLIEENAILVESASLMKAQVEILRKINIDLENCVAELSEQVTILTSREINRGSVDMLEDAQKMIDEMSGTVRVDHNMPTFTPVFDPSSSWTAAAPSLTHQRNTTDRSYMHNNTFTSPHATSNSPFLQPISTGSTNVRLLNFPDKNAECWSRGIPAHTTHSFFSSPINHQFIDRTPKDKWADIVGQLNSKFTTTSANARRGGYDDK